MVLFYTVFLSLPTTHQVDVDSGVSEGASTITEHNALFADDHGLLGYHLNGPVRVHLNCRNAKLVYSINSYRLTCE